MQRGGTGLGVLHRAPRRREMQEHRGQRPRLPAQRFGSSESTARRSCPEG